jgi:diguanylate cyclase (GGDEF)-like protein
MVEQRKKIKKQEQDKLKELAYLDDLTMLYNRRYLYQYLPEELMQMKHSAKRLCLLMLDVDNFKEINDAHGHLCGDRILVETAELLRKICRAADTIVRYAGDEFIAVLPEVDEGAAMDIAKKIVRKIDKNPFRAQQGRANIHVTLSIGLALYPRDAQDPEKLIHQADRALYFSKRSGRNRTCTTQDISEQILDETKLEEIFPAPRLIGRQKQLTKLKAVLEEAKKEHTRLILVKGERGIGKTRLISEFKKYAKDKGVTNVSVSCSPDISNQPYQVLIMALEHLFVAKDYALADFVRRQPQSQAAQLANYIPSVKRHLPAGFKVNQTQGPEQAQIELFKGICQSLSYAVKDSTLLLFIDDFQWIDKETLQLSEYIIKELREISLYIVAAYREVELKERKDASDSKAILTQLKKNPSTVELLLEPLEKDEVEAMMTTIFTGFQPQAKFVDMICDLSAGNPLFIEEMLRSLANKGFIYYQNGKWQTRQLTEVTLPQYLKEAIQKRVTELDPETQPVVSAAAVIGQVFDFDVLCKILKQDPGYVLEVIDRATRQHIIVPESPFQTDKFKFSSGATRDIIYNSLDPKQKERLHKELALIKEKMYKDNIAPVAGSLGYHFGKARDATKANLYGKMLLERARWMPSYEENLGFLQEALREKVEEIVRPLSAESLELVPRAARSLKLATQNMRLYPVHSAVRGRLVIELLGYLTDILKMDEALVFSSTETRLLVNGQELSEKATREAGTGGLLELINSHRIKSVTFKKGLKGEDLALFLEALGKNYDDFIAVGGIGGMLYKKGIRAIKIDAVQYEQVGKLGKKKSKFEEAMLVDYLVGKVSNLGVDKAEVSTWFTRQPAKLSEALKKISEKAVAKKGQDLTQAQADIIVKSLQKLSSNVLTPNKEGEGVYRQNIAQAIKGLDGRVRSQVIQTLSSDKFVPSRDMMKDIIKEFSDEEILDMAAKEYSDSQGDLSSLRHLLRRFLLDPQRKPKLLPKLKIKLHQMALDENEISWVLHEELWQELPLKERVKRFKGLSRESYRRLQVSKAVDSLVLQLLENGMYNEVGEVVEKLLGQLEAEARHSREETLNDLDKICETLIFREKYFLMERIINRLIARLDNENDPQVYSTTVLVLANSCVRLIKRQNFIQATGILKEFNLRLGKESRLLDIQRQAIKEVKDSIFTESGLLGWLTKLLAQRIEDHHDLRELSKVIYEIGPGTVGPLFDLTVGKDVYIDPFKSYALRWNVSKVFKSMGEEAVPYLKEKLKHGKVEEVRVALELLGHIQHRDAVKSLEPLLKHKDLNLRREAITTLGKIGGREAIKLLSELVHEEDSHVRLSAVWALANIGSKEVLPILKPLLKDETVSGEIERIMRKISRK